MKKILIVDDNIEYLSLLADCLNKDFETYKASGVKSALCVLENTSIDLVCSDYFMGDGTGLDLLEELRKNNVDNNILNFLSFLTLNANCSHHLSPSGSS